jgi:alkylhydroperoxidase/carboxymuconolactone decarboxylase family protein YurZ
MTMGDGRDAERQAELERVTRLRGFRYGLHDFEAEIDLDGLRRRNDHVEKAYTQPQQALLDRKTRELLIIAANVAQGDTVAHLQVHLHAAHQAGASPEELLEMLSLLETWLSQPHHARGLEAWRATFRPDIPPIDRVVELR